MKLFESLDAAASSEGIKGYPSVVVDQTNFHISDIIKRNLAGEQVMGNQNLSYDYTNESQAYDPEKVNPFNDMGFDLDNVIMLAKENGQQVMDLQNRVGELKRAMDQSKKIEEEKKTIDQPKGSPEPVGNPAK